MSDSIRESVTAYGASTRMWTVRDYYRAAAAGVFDSNEKLELIRGEVVELSPQLTRHASATYRLQESLRLVFPNAVIRCQMPLRLDDHNEPEPDILVALGPMSNYDGRHLCADDVQLIVEVADSSLAKDRTLKGQLYAEFKIPEYWLLDLKANQLEVYREPVLGIDSKWGYSVSLGFGAGEAVTPVKADSGQIDLDSIIPG